MARSTSSKQQQQQQQQEQPEGGASIRAVYEVTGDAAAALALLQQTPDDKFHDYHQCLLQASSFSSVEEWKEHLDEVEPTNLNLNTNHLNTNNKRGDDWIVTYNRGLALLTAGQPQESMDLVWGVLQNSSILSAAGSDLKKPLKKEALGAACRLAFLWLEGFLAVFCVGCPHLVVMEDDPNVEQITTWLNSAVEQVEDPQFKFLWSLYKSRLDFLERSSDGKLVDAKIRSARKELKQAMEIFQHKLRPNTDGSLASGDSFSSVPHPQNYNNNNNNNTSSLSRVLQGQNQAALNLKANTEQVKGNVKKSLILCAEAHDGGRDATYEPLHYNNLAIVYLTHGKPHLALHAWSKALQNTGEEENTITRAGTFQSDGTARPNVSLKILHNAAMGSLQAQKFDSAYACLATCLEQSSIWRKRPRCWLRLAEACIGLNAKKKKVIKARFSKLEINGETKGIMVQNANYIISIPYNDTLAPTLASPEDFEQVQANPLPRARTALEKALLLFESNDDDDSLGRLSAELSMSYVCLEDADYPTALKYAEMVLEQTKTITHSPEFLDSSVVQKTMWQRHEATARMYASEASCALGDAVQSMRYLVGDGKDDAFDRLASDLSGVTIETASSNPKGKARLAKAQAFVRCSASAASAHLGNGAAAKQLAMSAQAMEDAYSPASREGSSARRALVYCMLREGNSGAALTLLRSAR